MLNADDLIEVSLGVEVQGVECVNVLHYVLDAGGPGAGSTYDNLEEAANFVAGLYETVVIPELSVDAAVKCCLARRIRDAGMNPAPTQQVPGYDNTGTLGGVSVDSLPPQSTILVKQLSEGLPVRRANGRAYVSGCPQTFADGGQLINGASGDLRTALSSFFSAGIAIGGGGGSQVVYSRTANIWFLITDIGIEPVLRTIRERRAICKGFAPSESP